jgi:glutathionylspermidine synthase
MARVIRFDFHFTTEGWLISEANTDVPGGFIESCEFTQLMSACYPGTVMPGDTAAVYSEAIVRKLEPNSQIGFVHATAYTDDRQVMFFLADRFSRCGLAGTLISPADLDWVNGYAKIEVSGERLDGLIRFFPGEWLPNIPRRHKWEQFFYGSKTPISNPGYSLVSQSKRFPLIWDQLKTPMRTWKRLLPETRDPREVNWQDDDGWVLKPALGRVGEDIGMRGVTPEKEWYKIVRYVKRYPEYWIAQRRFSMFEIDAGDCKLYPCLGIFVIDGKASGIYGRISKKTLIDGQANDIAVIIRQMADNRSRKYETLYGGVRQ